MLFNSMLGSAKFYSSKINQSIRLNDDDSAYMSRTPGSPDNPDKQTYSVWVKRGNLGTDQDILYANQTGSIDKLAFDSSDKLKFYVNGGAICHFVTTAVYRDVGAWYHIHLIYDSAQATPSDRVNIYVNGIRWLYG